MLVWSQTVKHVYCLSVPPGHLSLLEVQKTLITLGNFHLTPSLSLTLCTPFSYQLLSKKYSRPWPWTRILVALGASGARSARAAFHLNPIFAVTCQPAGRREAIRTSQTGYQKMSCSGPATTWLAHTTSWQLRGPDLPRLRLHQAWNALLAAAGQERPVDVAHWQDRKNRTTQPPTKRRPGR